MLDTAKIKIIGFDADDTLWINETFFREAEKEFVQQLSYFGDEETILKTLYDIELTNMPLYGYGVKGFVLSLIETANKLSLNSIPANRLALIIDMGKQMLAKPVNLLEGVEDVLAQLSSKYQLIVATKGDLLDQQRKLQKSGLLRFFHHIEVMSDKNESSYQSLLQRLSIQPNEFVMIGNSLKSDILPVVNLGGYGIHVPFHTTWHHEEVNHEINSPLVFKVEKLNEVLLLLK